MFYSQFILAKKGPLGTIWIAAHLERKLRKNQVADTDIGVSVDSILCPDVPIALRLSSHLLLGVVRIYSRKVNYLFDDCSEALLKVKQAFRSTAVDLPPEQSKAPYHSITLPETFDLDDFELPDNEIFQGNDRHVSTREQITLQDTMDGVAFQTSQFGLDERFGDGDASQIGLDLDEALFMEKGDAAGTSGNLNNTDADQFSAKEATSPKDDEHTERVPDLTSPSSTNYVSIQAPSTPGLMEEPNLPSAKEGLVSDDHMDEDQNIPEPSAKEVSGTASCQVEPSCMHILEINSNGDCHLLDEQENDQAKSEWSVRPNETAEATSPSNAQPLESEHIETVSGVDSLGNKLGCSLLQNEGIVANDGQSIKELCEHDEAGLNKAAKVIFDEVHDQDTCANGEKADLDGSELPGAAIRFENNNSEESEAVMENRGYLSLKSDQPCRNLETCGTSKNSEIEKSSVLSTPVLKPCNSHSQNICGGENLPDASKVLAEDDGLCSLGFSSKQDATDVAEISTDVHDLTMPTLQEDQIAHEVADAIPSNLDKPLDNDRSGEDCLENENNYKISDFSAPEKLLSVPNLPAGQSDNVIPECTPGIEVVAGDGDASIENLLSGKKRSYTESTLTVQSFNSAASSGAAQSKQPAELVPEDDDLLSSILGGRSTAFKLKPTPPVADSLPAKRQRTSVRSSAHKRKVLMDDSMVLHGDVIREQLTNTEDIRRVRKKAPCTHLEVWVLQKHFLEDEVFTEPVFTGLLPEFRYLHSQSLDLSRIRVVQDDGSTGTNKTPVLSATGASGREEREDNLEEMPSRHESMFVVDALQKELETFDNEVAKQMSKQAPGEKAEIENNVQAGDEGNQAEASTAEPPSATSPVPEVTRNLTDNPTVDAPDVHETNDAVVSADIDASCQSVNEDNRVESAMEVACTMEEAMESDRQNQEVDVNVDEKLDDKTLLEKREGFVPADMTVVMEDVQGACSSPFNDIPVPDSVDLEGRVFPTSDRIMEECQSGEPRFENEEEIIASDLRHDENCPTSNNFLEEDVKLDPSPIVETDWSSRDTKLNELEDPQSLEIDPTLVPDSTAIPTEFTNPADHSDFGMGIIEHDTDFLNVDDDDVAEDYEDDTPNPEEKRLLDNSGWSSRTRAVANYLQVLFVKETHQPQKIIPLQNLLAGKTRKEASRMFFETLVLKTKDYIHTEQESAFSDIKIRPTGKLMKSEF